MHKNCKINRNFIQKRYIVSSPIEFSNQNKNGNMIIVNIHSIHILKLDLSSGYYIYTFLFHCFLEKWPLFHGSNKSSFSSCRNAIYYIPSSVFILLTNHTYSGRKSNFYYL